MHHLAFTCPEAYTAFIIGSGILLVLLLISLALFVNRNQNTAHGLVFFASRTGPVFHSLTSSNDCKANMQ